MKRSSKLMLFGLGLFLLAVVIVPPQSQSSSSGPTVIVGNTPLPVQGAVGINNLPAVQSVSGTVSVGNTPSVNVANTPTVNLAGGSSVSIVNPLDSQSNPAALITLEAAQPYEDSCSLSLTTGSLGFGCGLQTIPTGKRLVIQEVDIALSLDPGLKPTFWGLFTVSTNPPHQFTATFMGSDGYYDHFATHQETHLYVSKNQAPSCSASLSAATTIATDSFVCQISGFLVDTQ